MIEPTRVSDLAEAVADGRTPDWAAAEADADGPHEQALIARLRALQSIHALMTSSSRRPLDDDGRTVLRPGDRWGALEVRAHVGRGRFGDVYRAWDPALEREVALKLVRHTDRLEATEARVVDEGRMMARVRHPNVLAIHGAQRIDGVSGLWMEFVEGHTLGTELATDGPFSAEGLVHLGIEVARALAAVHQAGLVHRDVTAHNVLHERSGRIVLGDFGTGRDIDESDQARRGLAGTPAYLAPEVFDGRAATPQSDLYSLGALLFHLATGRYPVPGLSLRDLQDAHARADRVSLASLRPDLPPALVLAIERGLAADPRERFADASAMADAIAATAPPSSPAHAGRRVAVLAALAVAVAGVVGYAGYPRSSRPSSSAAQTTAAIASRDASTPSPRAFELFDQARQVAGAEGGVGMRRAHVVEQLAREALREDPDFVMAHLLLAHALYSQSGRAEEALPQLDQAKRSAEHRTAVDRHLAAGERHGMAAEMVFGDELRRLKELAVAEFEAAIALDANNDWALSCLVNLYPAVGRDRDALHAAERLVSLRPASLTALWRAAGAAHSAGRIEVASRYAERASQLDLVIDERTAFQAGWVRAYAAHAAWLQGDAAWAVAAADRTAAVVDELPPSARSGFAQRVMWVYLTLGRLREAHRMAELADPAARGFMVTRVASATLGHEMDERERGLLGEALARYFPDLRSTTSIILTWIDAGRLDQAEHAFALLERPPLTPPQYVHGLQGALALARGRAWEAIPLLELATRQDPQGRGTRPWGRNVMSLAEAYVATGQQRRAVELLSDATRDRGQYTVEGAHSWAPLRDRLAQLHRETGDTASAERIERELRGSLTLADDDHPIRRRLDRVDAIRTTAH